MKYRFERFSFNWMDEANLEIRIDNFINEVGKNRIYIDTIVSTPPVYGISPDPPPEFVAKAILVYQEPDPSEIKK